MDWFLLKKRPLYTEAEEAAWKLDNILSYICLVLVQVQIAQQLHLMHHNVFLFFISSKCVFMYDFCDFHILIVSMTAYSKTVQYYNKRIMQLN